MNRKIFLAALALTLPFVAMAADTNDYHSTINSDYTINSELSPDTVKLKFYVENSGTNLNEIKEKNDKTVSTAIAEIKKKLGQNESVKTIAFRVNNVYSYKDKIRIFQKYEVTNGFEVKLKDLNKISSIINTAMAQGIKRVDNPVFSIEDGQAICNESMANAIKGAKSRAEYLAKAAGASIDKVKNISPYCSLNSSYVQPRVYSNASMKAMDGTAGEAETVMYDSIEPGSINVRASVNMTYYLK